LYFLQRPHQKVSGLNFTAFCGVQSLVYKDRWVWCCKLRLVLQEAAASCVISCHTTGNNNHTNISFTQILLFEGGVCQKKKTNENITIFHPFMLQFSVESLILQSKCVWAKLCRWQMEKHQIKYNCCTNIWL